MRSRLPVWIGVILLLGLLTGCGSSDSSERGDPVEVPTNDDGSTVTGIQTARFDPTAGVVPFPTNLLFAGTTDLTLNIPVANPNDVSDPAVALNALDGFSTTAPWTTSFSAPLDPATVTPGGTVRVFQVSLASPAGAVTGIVRELRPGDEYVATLAGATTLAIVPLQPLPPLTSFMTVLTEGITDQDGNSATPDQTYFLAQRDTPLVDANGNSTEPLLDNATAQALEPLRRLVASQEAAAAAAGIQPNRIVLSWVFTTQSTFQVLGAVQSIVQAGETLVGATGLDTSMVGLGLPGLADIFVGRLDIPYYLDSPTRTNPDPTVILDTFWEAAPGAYIPPFDGFGLDPTSRAVTVYNPFPVVERVLPIPLFITVPNAASGMAKPASGWPVAIYLHGITRNRLDALAVADTLALAGFAVVAIDLPLHGVIFNTSPFYGGNVLPIELRSTERTFNVDMIDNETGAPGPDGLFDPSGAHFVNLSSLLTSRDNLRQGMVDVMVLAASIPGMDINQDGTPDFDGSRVHLVGQSLGAMVGIGALSVNPLIGAAVTSVPGGGIARFLEASPAFGPRIRAGLAQAGLQPGTPDFQAFFVAAQTVIDSADPVNLGARAAAGHAVLLQEVLGDQVIPNAVAGAPLSGTEPLIRVMGLAPISETTINPGGIRGAVRFTAGAHGSLLSPQASQAVTVEMQTEMASMMASDGTAVQVTNPSVIQSN